MEITDFRACLEDCDLTQINSTGAYYTWTNRTVWSRIDRAVANGYWYNVMGYTEVMCTVEGLSDHTQLHITCLTSPRHRNPFMFCEMWCSDPLFKAIIQHHCQIQHKGTRMHQV